ncbi:TPA: LAGLIDADG family homing endonuclease [Clostridium botulinum]|uniref:LAGLIDADG family homing endonuclease n=1 Tax=Clostridium botulinum TaxID=1491 RepID=UPI0029BCD872|nr:LAGLIDADG family homing endonuclease [Clostridium botulinum]HDK7189622.1 LAGLIDADG family homing endonuclease [Clostridium botulinum]HDK7217228.1 LAGLIDADG family homing endonuclease [Clostridium botulinum]HDK7232682.1 LAGLIDADG family homing endonuclease [Clostridium botulinum]HDK7259485.1 LAGLIDADG family homing endonuclease [Clostridium botulinum]
MTNEQKAYIAGIIDGEGSIMLLRFHNNQFPSPCISISSTTIELLEWIKSLTKIGTIKRKKNYNAEKHTDSFAYTIKYNDAINLLIQIEPYLVIKNKKAIARLIIKKYKSVTPRNGKYSDEMLKAKEEFYKEFISIK